MKKCKIISLYLTDANYFIDKGAYYVADHPEKERIIDGYLAKGYEVKNISNYDTTVYVYLEKDV